MVSRDSSLIGLLAAGLLLRVGMVFWLQGDMVPRGDETTYLRKAQILLDTGQLETGNFVRPPLYFVFLAFLGAIAGKWGATTALLAKLVQCVLSAATAIPVYRTANRLAGRKVARIAAAVFLLNPTLIAYANLIWPETLFLFLLAWIFDGLPRLGDRGPAASIGYGLMFGAAMLLKPVLGLLALMLVVWWWWRLDFRRALRIAVPFALAAFVVVSPWAIRNQLRYGPSIVLENQGPYNLWIGSDPRPGHDIHKEWKDIGDPVERSRYAMQQGRAAIAEDPGRFVRMSAVRALNLWGLEYFVVRLMVIGGYGQVERGSFVASFWLIQLSWAALLAATALGLRRAWRDPTLRLLLLHAVVFSLLVATMVGTTRFRVPFAFVLSVTAALGIDSLIARRIGPGDFAALGLALALLVGSVSRPMFTTIVFGEYAQVSDLFDEDWRFFRY